MGTFSLSQYPFSIPRPWHGQPCQRSLRRHPRWCAASSYARQRAPPGGDSGALPRAESGINMNRTALFDKAYGCLLSGLIGDAMGTPTENMEPAAIAEK